MFKVQIQFRGKEFHDNKSFKDPTAALNFIYKHKDNIVSVNHQPIRALMAREKEIKAIELIDKWFTTLYPEEREAIMMEINSLLRDLCVGEEER